MNADKFTMGGIGGAPDTMNVNIADAAASKMHASGMPTVGQAVEDEGGFDKPYKGSGEGATGKASSMTSGSGIESQGNPDAILSNKPLFLLV